MAFVDQRQIIFLSLALHASPSRRTALFPSILIVEREGERKMDKIWKERRRGGEGSINLIDVE